MSHYVTVSLVFCYFFYSNFKEVGKYKLYMCKTKVLMKLLVKVEEKLKNNSFLILLDLTLLFLIEHLTLILFLD